MYAGRKAASAIYERIPMQVVFGILISAEPFHWAAVPESIPKVRQLGVDVAVSRDLKPWVLEVNTNPAVTPFIALGNKRMYRRIIQLRRFTVPARLA